MRFWDSSALVALVVEQQATERVRPLLTEDADQAVWVLSEVELRSGIERRVEAVESGAVALESWEDAKRRIEKNILGR